MPKGAAVMNDEMDTGEFTAVAIVRRRLLG